MKKLLLFGAGKIGRSFIAQLFSRSGYEVVFVDIDQEVIDELTQRQQYIVHIKDDIEEKILIENVRGIAFSETEKTENEIAEADILAVSVGKNGLKAVIPLIAKGLLKREMVNGNAVDLIIAENMRNADSYIYKELQKHLPTDFPLKSKLGLVETSIGKMVPIMQAEVTKKDPLLVFAEAYNTLILDRKGFINEIPIVKGLAPKENMKAWVDRKLFIHNFGHAATAYLGYQYNNSFKYTWEPLRVNAFYNNVYKVMKQSAEVLQKMYPKEFTTKQLDDHIIDLLKRFQNQNLGDTIFRVGCDLYRKLAPDDRVVTPLKTAMKFNLPFEKITEVLCSGVMFEKKDSAGKLYPPDEEFITERRKYGKEHILQTVSKLNQQEISRIKKAGTTSCFQTKSE